MSCWLRRVAAVCAVWLLTTAAVAAQDGTLTRVALARGGTLFVVEDRRVPLVTVRFAVPIGRHARGWDHESEVAWRLQTIDSRIDVSEQLALLPADLVLDVEGDQVTLEATALARDLEALVSLLAVVLNSDYRGLSFDMTEDLATWQEVANRVPSAVLDQTLRRALLAEGDSRRPAAEAPQDVVVSAAGMRARRDAMVRRPERVLGFAGAVSADDAQRLANRLLLPVDRHAGPLPTPASKPLRPAEGVVESQVLDGIASTWLGFGRLGLRADDPDLAATRLAEAVARDRIQERIRGELGATYSVSSWGLFGRTEDLYTLALSTHPDEAQGVIEEVRGILADLAAGGIEQAELERVRERELAWLALGNQDPADLLAGAMTQAQHGERVVGAAAWREAVEGVDLAAVNGAAAFLDPKRLATVVLRPD